ARGGPGRAGRAARRAPRVCARSSSLSFRCKVTLGGDDLAEVVEGARDAARDRSERYVEPVGDRAVRLVLHEEEAQELLAAALERAERVVNVHRCLDLEEQHRGRGPERSAGATVEAEAAGKPPDFLAELPAVRGEAA